MGRPWGGGKPTPASFFELDIRWLKRQGMLRPGKLSWVREIVNGNRRGLLSFLAGEGEGVINIAGHRQWVLIEETPVHLGGARQWFRCPRCSRLAAKIYGSPRAGGPAFTCRSCKRIAYPSQNEDKRYLSVRRAQRIRESLGGSPNLTLSFPPKPKGMHRTTYDRAHATAMALEQRSLASMAATVEKIRRRCAARG